MKLKITPIILIIIPFSIFAQPNNLKLMDYVNTFTKAKTVSNNKITQVKNSNQAVIDKLSKLDIKTKALEEYIKSLSPSNFLKIISKRIKAYEEDLYGPQEYWMEFDTEVSKKYSSDSIRFGIYENILRNHLEDLYGEAICNLIMSPVLLRVKVIGQETEPYDVKNNITLKLKVITAEIEDMIKGENHFTAGEKIQFYYMPFWKHTENEFLDNEEYFVSLIPIIDNKNGEHRLALDVNKINDGIIKLSKGILLDNKDYYGFGKISWQEFKNKISSLININNIY